MKVHVKKSDLVVVLNGNDRGKRGKVVSVDTKKGRLVVEGVRMIKKAMRKSQDRPQGGFLEREGTIHSSNVMLAEIYDKRNSSDAKKSEK
jgi:large subunit ribosomal protein L24